MLQFITSLITFIIGSADRYTIYSIYVAVVMAWWIRIRIRNLYCPYFTEKHQGTRKYTNKDIWTPTRYKQTKKLRENTKQCYNIIKYNVEQNDDEMALLISWHMPQTIAAIILGRHRTRRWRQCSETIWPHWLWADQPQLRHRSALCDVYHTSCIMNIATIDIFLKKNKHVLF